MAWLWNRSREMARDIWLVLRVRSFQLIVLQVSVLSGCYRAVVIVSGCRKGRLFTLEVFPPGH